MSQCPNGHAVTKGARFCRECGEVVGAAAAEATIPAIDATTQVRHTSIPLVVEPRSRSWLLIAVLAAVVVAAVAGGAGAVLLADNSNSPQARTPRRGATSSSTPTASSSSSSSTSSTTTTTAPPVLVRPVQAAPVCVRDDTPVNLHVIPGTHADVIGLIMVGDCGMTDVVTGSNVQYTNDGGNFRHVSWRGMDGWVRASVVGAVPFAVPQFGVGPESGCTQSALLSAWSAAESHAYKDDPQYSVVSLACSGTDSGAIAFARLRRAQLNPDGRTSEALFRSTGSGWRELAHSGPRLMPEDYAGTGIPETVVDGLRSSAA